MSIEAMKQALEALAASDDFLFNYHDCEPNNEREMDAYSEIRANNHEAFMALRTAIEQAEKRWSEFNETTKRNIEHADWYLSTHSAPEPVGVVKVLPLGDGHKPMHWADWTDDDNHPPEGTLLYTTPPAAQRQWVGLTDEDYNTNMFSITSLGACDIATIKSIAKDVEAKLKEKNT